MGRANHLGQCPSHLGRQVQAQSDPAGLNAQNVYLRALRGVEEFQSLQQAQAVQGMTRAGPGKVLATALIESARRLAAIQGIDHEDVGTPLQERQRTEEIRLSRQDDGPGRRIGGQETRGVDSHAVIGQQAIADSENQMRFPWAHRQ
ncbi:MAG: hypothetical protein MUC88_15705 [Planctomycetes bacterium]|jgi:hypothetical protein|nr:hypothetical protein [Planctomycetota bacterium]